MVASPPSHELTMNRFVSGKKRRPWKKMVGVVSVASSSTPARAGLSVTPLRVGLFELVLFLTNDMFVMHQIRSYAFAKEEGAWLERTAPSSDRKRFVVVVVIVVMVTGFRSDEELLDDFEEDRHF